MATNTQREIKVRELFIEKCWTYLNDNFHKFTEANKIKIALALAQKNVPQQIDAQVKDITRMPCVKIDGKRFIPLVGNEPKDSDGSSSTDSSDAAQAAAASDTNQ